MTHCQSVEDSIKEYKTLSQKVFTSKSKDETSTFDYHVLVAEIKRVVSNFGKGLFPDAELKDTNLNLCHTFVISTCLRSAGGAIRMRTYDTLTADAFDAYTYIWEAARATCAAPTFFSPIYIDDVRYGDGGTGWNNPTKEAIAETQNIWPNRPIGCIVSIGTGLEEALQLNEKGKEISGFVAAILQKTSPKLAFQVAVAEYLLQMFDKLRNHSSRSG